MKTTHLFALVLAGTFACGTALAEDTATTPTSTHKVKKMDTDGDGRLSMAEFTAGGRKTAEDFAKYDVNGDGYVTDEEIEVGKERGLVPGEKKDARGKAHPVPTTNPKSPDRTDTMGNN